MHTIYPLHASVAAWLVVSQHYLTLDEARLRIIRHLEEDLCGTLKSPETFASEVAVVLRSKGLFHFGKLPGGKPQDGWLIGLPDHMLSRPAILASPHRRFRTLKQAQRWRILDRHEHREAIFGSEELARDVAAALNSGTEAPDSYQWARAKENGS
jgi:hypothetical protein